MQPRKWPRRNDPESIRARQDALAGLTNGSVAFGLVSEVRMPI